MAETVIVMTVLLAMMFGIIDFGRALYTYSFVAQLARQGARWTIVRGTNCNVLDHCSALSSDVQTYVQSLSYGATNSSNISASASSSSSGCNAGGPFAPGCTVKVTVSYPFNFMLPFVPSTTINMSSSSTMVVSN